MVLNNVFNIPPKITGEKHHLLNSMNDQIYDMVNVLHAAHQNEAESECCYFCQGPMSCFSPKKVGEKHFLEY